MFVSNRDDDFSGLDKTNDGQVQVNTDNSRYTLSATGDPPRPRYQHRRPRATRTVSVSAYQSFRRIPDYRTGGSYRVSTSPGYETSDTEFSPELTERRRNRERYNNSDDDWYEWPSAIRRKYRTRQAQAVLADRERETRSKGFRQISLPTSDDKISERNPQQVSNCRSPLREEDWGRLKDTGTQQPPIVVVNGQARASQIQTQSDPEPQPETGPEPEPSSGHRYISYF
ncbi:hypothetical protein BDW72DRAFT_198864 [Aspergillus terricola var. indicus]